MSEYSLVENAMALESSGKYSEALELFKILLSSSEHDKGDLLFHCGWCLENLDQEKLQTIISFYEKAALTTSIPLCRMNSFFRSGWLKIQANDYQGADVYFRKSIEMHEAAHVDEGIYHQSVYWYAICREFLGYYIEAIKLHQYIQKIAPLLNPESRYREIQCLIQIGSYPKVQKICQSFKDAPPAGFDKIRYQQLRDLAELEYRSLQNCFHDRNLTKKEL